MTSRSGIRLFVDAPLEAGGRVAASPQQAHYLRNVMRRAPGDAVQLFNGRDGEWRAEISDLGKRGGGLTVVERTRAQIQENGPWLLIAPVKRAAIDLVAEKATELGAGAIWPVMTERTHADRVNVDRLAAIAREAAEQCGRLTVPEMRAPAPLAEALAAWPEGRALYLLDETGAGTSARTAFAAAGDRDAAILIGPEGGFSGSELDAVKKLSFVTAVGLGGRILRAETAAIAALACYQAAAEGW